MQKALLDIARKYYVGFETLDVRGRDSLDFRYQHVGLIREALESAYMVGLEATGAVQFKTSARLSQDELVTALIALKYQLEPGHMPRFVDDDGREKAHALMERIDHILPLGIGV